MEHNKPIDENEKVVSEFSEDLTERVSNLLKTNEGDRSPLILAIEAEILDLLGKSRELKRRMDNANINENKRYWQNKMREVNKKCIEMLATLEVIKQYKTKKEEIEAKATEKDNSTETLTEPMDMLITDEWLRKNEEPDGVDIQAGLDSSCLESIDEFLPNTNQEN